MKKEALSLKVKVCFTVKGGFDSQELWETIGDDGMNVTDMGDTVWIYGSTSLNSLVPLIRICSRYGELGGGIQWSRR